MKKPIVHRSFVLSYVAIAVLTLSTGLVLKYMPSISADTATTSATSASTFTWKGCVDGAANIQFGADPTDVAVKVLDFTYKAIGTHADCASKFQDTAPAGTTTGSLTNCATITLGDSNSSRVTITNDTSIALRKIQGDSAALQPFKVHIADNGTGPFDYQFSLICTKSAVATTPTPTASSTTNSITLKHGFNTVLSPSDDPAGVTLDSSPITTAGMILFDFNRIGQKNWRSTARSENIPYLYNQVGYYVYNPGTATTLALSTVSLTPTPESQILARRSWNLLSNPTSSSVMLANYKVNVLKQSADNTCMDTSCFDQVTLHDLMAGDDLSRRAYNVVFEITDGSSTDASKAYTQLTVNSGNIDTVSLPAQTVFWLYLFN